jgi:hypothetical protein
MDRFERDAELRAVVTDNLTETTDALREAVDRGDLAEVRAEALALALTADMLTVLATEGIDVERAIQAVGRHEGH